MPYAATATVRTPYIGGTASMRLRTWDERLNWALRERGVTKSELARACKIERASVTEWTNGKTKNPKLGPFFLACDALNLNPRWLALGDGPIEPMPEPDYKTRESVLETITRLAETLSVAEQKRVMNILQGPAEARPR